MTLNDVLRVHWKRSGRGTFTLIHALWDGRTMCGLEIPTGALYEATTKGPTCTRCMNTIARAEGA